MAKLTEAQLQKVEEGGWIHASSMTEVQGNDEGHVKESLEKLIEKLKNERNVEIVAAVYSEPKDLGDNIISMSVDLEYLTKDFSELTKVALLYSPSFVEIHSPKEIKVSLGDAQNILADISATVTSLAQALFVQGGKLKQLQDKEAQK